MTFYDIMTLGLLLFYFVSCTELGKTGAYGETDLDVALLGFVCSPASQSAFGTAHVRANFVYFSLLKRSNTHMPSAADEKVSGVER